MGRFHLGRRGQGTLLIVSVLCVVGVIVLMTSLDVFTKDYNYKSIDFDQVLLDEATSSSFAVMESALSRRLWEPPPDSNCLKAETFSVDGSLPNGITWKVDTTFNFTTKNFEMTATGKYRRLTSTFKKRVKVLDVSDYLLFSGSDDEVVLGRNYDPTTPAALIAKDRRIYTQGPLQAYGMVPRANPNTDWSGSTSVFPGEWGTIIQGDRMQFGGGLYYRSYAVPQPNPSNATLLGLLSPYSNAWGTPQKTLSSFGGGSMVITKDSSVAETLRDQVINGSGTPNTKASLKNQVYPVALFGGNPPLESWNASDSGNYFNDVDRYSIFYYNYAGANNFGIRINATCMSKPDAFDAKKYCSHSEHFPKGFKQWRKDAGLDGYLYTSDSEVVPSPSMNWDNLEALEDDAKLCGQVISTPVSAYEDCAIWDNNFLQSYAGNSSTACAKISRLDMESLSLNNFNPSQLTDASLSDRLLRRVVYTKVPTEIKQSNNAGLMVSALSNNAARQKFALWIVGEDTISLRGAQADTTSPLDTDPGRLREVVFNKDSTGANKPGISMVLLSPEQVHLLSPFYVPMDQTYMNQRWPSSGGKIKPIIHNLTDPRYEEDGFKYGYRRFYLNNISLITTAKTNVSAPFVMQGLWSGPDSGAEQFIANGCMVSTSGQPVTAVAPSSVTDYAQAGYRGGTSPLPAAGSKYYNGSELPLRFYPNVFWKQMSVLGPERQESDLLLTGIRIYVNFDATVIPGKRDLTTPLHAAAESRYQNPAFFDISHKHFTYDRGVYYKPKPAFTPCIQANAEYIVPASASETTAPYAVNPSVNNGRYVFVQTSPDSSYRNIGSIVGVDQPVIETRNTK